MGGEGEEGGGENSTVTLLRLTEFFKTLVFKTETDPQTQKTNS